ncbi:MAG: peptidoglycan-binding protein [Fibrobacter sp.]|nr:peptidoglycan-binding protein [Fibrobacter sp.]
MKSLYDSYGWPTDPGAVDNTNGPKTKDAVNAFQGEYNNRFDGSLKQDGVMGQNTWSALFEVIRDLLVESVKSEIGEEPSGLVYSSNNNGVYPCGESFPIDEKGKDDYKSRENRRVEIVFFDKGKAPELIKPENKKKVKKSEAVIYDKRITEKKPVFSKPVQAENSETIVLEWVYPQVFDASKPHKQYVNLDSNGKEQGTELTIKVRAKDLKEKTAGKNVYWRVTADNKNSKRNSPKTGIMDKAGGKQVEFTAGIANLDTPFEKNEASIVLACGLAGGDRFTVEAGTDGENFTSKFVVENWRRLWYQLTHHQSVTPPSMATPIENLKTVFIEFLSETPCTHTRTATGNVIVGNHNAGEYHKLLSTKNKDRCCHIILCDKQYDGKDSTGRDLVSEATQIFKSNSDFIQMSDPANKLKIFNPPLQTGSNFLVNGKWKNLAKKTNGTFTDDPTKTNLSTGLVSFHDNDFVKVDLPPNANPSATDSVEVTIKVTAACGPWGGDGGVAPHNLVVINSNDTIHSQCVMHELGHLMKMVPDPTYYLCPPGFNYADHTMKYTKMGGSGSHCSYKINKALSTKTKYVDGRCIMFHQLNNNCELIYCPDCLPFVKAQALTTLK